MCTAAPIRDPLTGDIIGILDVTGDYRLVRPFFTNTLAEATLQTTQHMNTILTANHEKGYAINGRGTTYSFPGDAHSLSLNMQQKTSTYTITLLRILSK